MFITVTELKTHLYPEIVNEVARYPAMTDAEEPEPTDPEQNEIALEAIKTAISEATGYMSRYDTTIIFNAAGEGRDAHLVNIIKDMAVWHFIVLANANVELALREKRYDNAIEYLVRVQSGKVVPDWPYVPQNSSLPGGGAGQSIKFNSNNKRRNHY
jgi:hypothetical protein